MTARRNHDRRTRLATALALVLALACGGEAPPSISPAEPVVAAPAPTVVFAGRLRPLPPWGADFRKRIDARTDGWPSEVAAEYAETSLETALLALFARREFDALTVLARGGPVATRGLPPCATTQRLDDGAVRVESAELDSALSFAREEAAREHLRAFAARYAERGPVRIELACERIDAAAAGGTDAPAGGWTTELRLRVIAGPAADGARLEDAFVLRALWEQTPEGALVLRTLERASRLDAITVARPVLRGITRAVFGADPCWSEEFLRGNGDYHLRQDRLSNQPMLGMHGLAVGDVDGDGLEDVYVPQPGGQANRLFVHRADGTAQDVAHMARVDFLDNSSPALFCDFDGDGDQDLAVGSRQHVFLAWNDGRGNFAQGQVLRGPDEPEITTLAAADPDLDGDLDLFACRYGAGGMIGAAPAPYHNAHNGAENLYWRNDGKHAFTECAKELGLESGAPRFTFAALWHDFDDDGDPDLYLVNDFGENQLLKNEGGRFVDVARELGVTDQAAGMGVDVADADLDGRLDLYVTNMHSSAGLRITRQGRFLAEHPELKPDYVRHARGNTLLRGLENGRFEDVTDRAEVGPAGWGWGARFFDLQNDGLPELYAPNGFVSNGTSTDLSSFFWRCVIASTSMAPPPDAAYVNAWNALRHFTTFEGWSYAGEERKRVFLNLGGLAFVEGAGALGADFLGDGRVALPLDWDDDGRQDLLLRDRSGPRLRLLRNEHPNAKAWISFELVGTRSNKDAIGARVRFRASGVQRQQEVHSQAGFLCGASRRLHFGLGDAREITGLEVRWPGGVLESFGPAEPGARYRLVEGTGRALRVAPKTASALASLATDPAELGADAALAVRPMERIVLLDRLPLAALELPRYDGEARIAALAGAPALLVLADAGDALSKLAIEACAARAKDARIAVVVQGATDARAALRARLAQLGLEARAGEADARFLEALQVFLIDVLGPFEALPLPLVLELDAAGQLAAVRAGSADVEAALRDLAALGNSEGRGTLELNPGRVVAEQGRDLASVAQVFDLVGRADLARFCRERLKARGGH